MLDELIHHCLDELGMDGEAGEFLSFRSLSISRTIFWLGSKTLQDASINTGTRRRVALPACSTAEIPASKRRRRMFESCVGPFRKIHFRRSSRPQKSSSIRRRWRDTVELSPFAEVMLIVWFFPGAGRMRGRPPATLHRRLQRQIFRTIRRASASGRRRVPCLRVETFARTAESTCRAAQGGSDSGAKERERKGRGSQAQDQCGCAS